MAYCMRILQKSKKVKMVCGAQDHMTLCDWLSGLPVRVRGRASGRSEIAPVVTVFLILEAAAPSAGLARASSLLALFICSTEHTSGGKTDTLGREEVDHLLTKPERNFRRF